VIQWSHLIPILGWLIGAYAKVERSIGKPLVSFSQLSLLTHFRLTLTYEKVVYIMINNNEWASADYRRFIPGSGLLG